MNDVFFWIPTHNDATRLAHCLVHLRACYPDAPVVVYVDRDPQHELSRQLAEKFNCSVDQYRGDLNWGVPSACTRFTSTARGGICNPGDERKGLLKDEESERKGVRERGHSTFMRKALVRQIMILVPASTLQNHSDGLGIGQSLQTRVALEAVRAF